MWQICLIFITARILENKNIFQPIIYIAIKVQVIFIFKLKDTFEFNIYKHLNSNVKILVDHATMISLCLFYSATSKHCLFFKKIFNIFI